MQQDYLMHHGILGQKWGIRRYQNFDGTLTPAGRERYGISERQARKEQRSKNRTAEKGIRSEVYRQKHTIPKGTTIYRTTTNPNEEPNGPMYVSYIDADRYNYRGGWVRKAQNADKAYENRYTLKQDLTVPGRDELSQVICDQFRKNPQLKKQTAEAWVSLLPKSMLYKDLKFTSLDELRSFYSDSEKRNAYEQQKTKEFVKDVIKNMKDAPVSNLYFQCAQTFGKNPELKNAVISELQKRGYNAMTDEASVGGQNGWGREGIDPLIVFDGGSALQKSKTKQISRWQEANDDGKSSYWRLRAEGTGGAWSDNSTGHIL